MSECTDKKSGALLHAYELNVLSQGNVEDFEIHLLACEYCFNEINDFQKEAALLTSNSAVQDMAREAAGKSLTSESFTKKLRHYIWPDAPLVFRPAFVYILLFITIIPIYKSYERYRDVEFAYRPQQEAPLQERLHLETIPKKPTGLRDREERIYQEYDMLQKKRSEAGSQRSEIEQETPPEPVGEEPSYETGTIEEALAGPPPSYEKEPVSQGDELTGELHLEVEPLPKPPGALFTGTSGHLPGENIEGLEESQIRPVQSIFLFPDRSTDENVLGISAGKEGLVSFLFRGAIPGENYKVVIESQDESEIFIDNNFTGFDKNETGRLILPIAQMKPDTYRLIITDPQAEPPLDKQEYHFRIAE